MVRRARKPISIFSMSALDLFASAMGAFILLMLILLPYYEATTREAEAPEPPKCELEAQSPPDCPLCPVIEPKICPKITPPRERVEVIDNLLMATIEWYDAVDVDLVIYAPGSRKYFWGRNRYPGLDAYFVDDNYGTIKPERDQRPLMEVWKFYQPIEGVYTVCGWLHVIHNFNPMRPSDVSFTLRLEKPTGAIEYTNMTFTREGEEICPLKFRMSADYKFTRIP